MAYTPINWQTGDTITAEKMNKMDNGWGVQSTQLFSETVTTASGQHGNEGTLAYSEAIDANFIIVNYDGVEYECNKIMDGIYGGYNYGPDFTEYPFLLYSYNGTNTLYTETAGSHTISAGICSIDVSSYFTRAVSLASNTFRAIEGQTTWLEVLGALSDGKMVYIITEATSEAARSGIVAQAYYDENAQVPFVLAVITVNSSQVSIMRFSALNENGVIQREL